MLVTKYNYKLAENMSDLTTLQVLFLNEINTPSYTKQANRRSTSTSGSTVTNSKTYVSGMTVEELNARFGFLKGLK